MNPSGEAAGARKPVAFGDMRGWIEALRGAGELREIDAEVDWDVELGTIYRMAQGKGDRPAFLFRNIKDYNGAGRPLPGDFRRRPGRLFAPRHDVRPAAGHAGPRPGPDLPHHLQRTHPAGDGGHRPGEGERPHRRRYRPARLPGAQVEPARRRALRADLCRLRDQGPRYRTAQCRHLSRHGGRPGLDPGPDVAGAALGRALHQIRGAWREDAGRLRARLGALARLHRGRAGAARHLRIRRDGRDPRANRSSWCPARRCR